MTGYPQELRYFMWPWQVHYRISCQTSADSLFNYLDKGLQPYAFLIGIAMGETISNEAICIEPENLHYRPEEFSDVRSVANGIFETREESEMFYTDLGMQEEMYERHQLRSFQTAVEKIINESPNNPGKVAFASVGVMVNNYLVFVVVELDRELYNAHTHLHIDESNGLHIYRSLLEAATKAYLEERSRTLYYPHPGKSLSSDSRSHEELLRESALGFMSTVATKGNNFFGLHGLFEICNLLSLSRYEGSENLGHLIIAEKNDPDIEIITGLSNPFPLADIRKSRKLLQVTNTSLAVISDSCNVYGLGKLKPAYNEKREAVCDVFFRGIHCWDVTHNGTVLLQMRYGMPQFPQEIISKEKIFTDITRIFPSISEAKSENLYTLAMTVAENVKGSMLVIVDDAKQESDRLGKQCFQVEPFTLTPDSLLGLNSIDGAVLIDTSGVVYAYGVILDGIVGSKGNSARGSRYNSAITYHESRGFSKPTLIIVVSEDGMVDVIPTLMPQVKHSEIRQVIEALEDLNKKEVFDPGPFNKAMEWLTRRMFYLTEEECNRINTIKNNIYEKPKENTTAWIVYRDLHPNPEMNEHYYATEV